MRYQVNLEEYELVIAGKKLEAVQKMRNRIGCGLREAYDACSNLPPRETLATPLPVTFTLEVHTEDLPVRGNVVASGNKEVDKEYEDKIITRIDAGDVWAWCIVVVKATIELDGQKFQGYDTLGACSYDSEEDFKVDGYYEDLKNGAVEHLKVVLQEAMKRGTVAAVALGRL